MRIADDVEGDMQRMAQSQGSAGYAHNGATFYMKPKQDDEATLREGRPIFVAREYVRISVPGDRSNIVERPARDEDRMRYPRQYAAFKAGTNQDEASGTLLSAWGGVPPERIEELAAMRIKTVEQLAAVHDENLQKLGNTARGERQRARDYIETMKGHAPVAQLRAEVEKRDAQMEAMQRQLKEQAEIIAQMQKTKAKETTK